MRQIKIIWDIRGADSLQIAKHFRGEIISADSRQIYKHMNIGTDKIDASQQ